jgi:hypothetical protein
MTRALPPQAGAEVPEHITGVSLDHGSYVVGFNVITSCDDGFEAAANGGAGLFGQARETGGSSLLGQASIFAPSRAQSRP